MPLLDAKIEFAKLLPDQCTQEITPKRIRDALEVAMINATASVSPVYSKEYVHDPDEMFDPSLIDHSLQVTMEDLGKEVKIWDEVLGIWRIVYSEKHVQEMIAAASKFEGVVAESGHAQGLGVNQFSDLAGMMTNLSEAELLLKVGHYFTWNGTDGYTVTGADLNGELVGAVLQTNDWLQLVNIGGDITDPTDPDYALLKPDFHTIHISGDNLSKTRADGLYSFDPWIDGSYEAGSIVTDGGKVYKATTAIALGDTEPMKTGSFWTEIDLTGVTAGTVYLGKGNFDNFATVFDQANNWGMPLNVYPQNRKPHDGDAFLDVNTSATVIFHVDKDTGVVTVQHEYGHTRDMSFTLDPALVVGDKVTLLGDIPANSEGVIEFQVVDKSTAGVTAEFEFVIAGPMSCIKPRVIVPSATPMFNYVAAKLNNNGNYDVVLMLAAPSIGQDIEVEVRTLDYDLGIFNHPDGTASVLPTSDTDIFTSVQYPFPNRVMLVDNGDTVVTDHNDKDILLEKNAAADKIVSVHVRDGLDMLPLARNISLEYGKYLDGTAGPAKGSDSDYVGQQVFDFDKTGQGLLATMVSDQTNSFWNKAIGATPVGTSGGELAFGIIVLTQLQYDAIATPDPTTLYFIKEK